MIEKKNEPEETNYRIGAVARLTGIAPDTLRIWERRYELVVTTRTASGTRLYSRDDVQRLTLIKRLVDAGQAIGTVARLSIDQLQSRLHAAPALFATPGSEERPCRLVVLGEGLPARLSAQSESPEPLELVGLYRDRRAFDAEAAGLDPDVVLVELATVHKDSGRFVNQLMRVCGATRAVVVYRFGSSTDVSHLQTTYCTALRGPLDPVDLRRLCAGAAAPSRELAPDIAAVMAQPLPRRRFDNEALARTATASTVVRCECPHHLAELVSSLSAFETYSAECENRSAEDAALHGYLRATAAQARCLIEQALEKVLEAEGVVA